VEESTVAVEVQDIKNAPATNTSDDVDKW
jgi:hypothetical protein